MSDIGARLAGGQIVGCRDRQEDDFAILDLGSGGRDRVIVAVADGMGGHAGGAEAAQCATRQFMAWVEQGDRDADQQLESGLAQANTAIAELVHNREELAGAGCTLVAAAIEGERLSWISVGDSSLLLLRDGTLTRLNEDHSMRPILAEMVKTGRMTAAEAEKHSSRNALRSAVTGDELAIVDRRAIAIQPGDQLLLASDGLDVLEPSAIAAALKKHRGEAAEQAVRAVLSLVEDAGVPRQDNATVVLYRVPGAGTQSAQRGAKGLYVLAVFALVLLVAGGAVTARWLMADPAMRSSWWSHLVAGTSPSRPGLPAPRRQAPPSHPSTPIGTGK